MADDCKILEKEAKNLEKTDPDGSVEGYKKAAKCYNGIDKEKKVIDIYSKIAENRPEVASWLVDFESQIRSFPVGAHDDYIDMMSQALRYLVDNDRPSQRDDEAWSKIKKAGAM